MDKKECRYCGSLVKSAKKPDLNLSLLKEGDRVRNRATGNCYIVTEKHGPYPAVGIRSVTITNPSEWELVT